MKNLKNSLFISLIIGLSLSLFFSMLFADGKYYPLNPQSTIGILYYNHFTETTVIIFTIIFIVVYTLIWIIQFFKNKNYVDTINEQLKQLKWFLLKL